MPSNNFASSLFSIVTFLCFSENQFRASSAYGKFFFNPPRFHEGSSIVSPRRCAAVLYRSRVFSRRLQKTVFCCLRRLGLARSFFHSRPLFWSHSMGSTGWELNFASVATTK
ncbi:unnamed protein product [Scytosiphon promiscuus]